MLAFLDGSSIFAKASLYSSEFYEFRFVRLMFLISINIVISSHFHLNVSIKIDPIGATNHFYVHIYRFVCVDFFL